MSLPIERIDEYRWRIPAGAKPGMKVPAVIFADDRLMEQIKGDLSLEQAANAATLPGAVRAAYTMPDIHQGYGLPIGAVVATRMEGGVVTPGGVGYDINCGVRLLRTDLTKAEVLPRLRELVNLLFADVPTGVGSHGKVRLTRESQTKPLTEGARWAVTQGMGETDDLTHAEAAGCIPGADPDAVSHKAHERGRDQLGTLGSGNHFLEVQVVERIYDEQAANVLGLFPGQVTVLVHTGSRGFGHQVCTDYLASMERALKKYGIQVPDRQLACAPVDSDEAVAYLGAMRAAANYAWANRQCLTHWTREAFQKVFKKSPRDLGMSVVYDVAHNIAKVEEHMVEGRSMRLVVHRKGATRAFPPGHPELPERYRSIGQPVLVPGDMGRASFVLVGTKGAMDETFGSTCHGAGRLLSRAAAIKAGKGRSIERELEDTYGVYAKASGRDSMKEEMPEAYKNVQDVVTVCHNAGISKMVAKLRPLGCIKG
ncbi:MAG: RNA-splicing ligase RtcB [candidate division NC10 bacterium RBG_16_65_8]|nr:MAG: RNA-splicing ligase RtcB [candidate division NC10 bacterium RBG_16_65_8]